MSAATGGSRHEILEGIVRAVLPEHARNASLLATDNLFERGLDSLAVAAVLMEIERTFDVNVPERYLCAEAFASLETIDRWLSALLEGPCGSS